ncbi:Metallo-dependent phosphatase [Trichodelitschia bisporula]|uniref:Metallo-dependent phosphatase n=1 Tax=Trichodelitschia bisporula TaxID=703511 RepID=A0A6G1HTG3_9PEZI|nr:Metallo-dependent phosphatase [Trichodelitschia bisporula]
MTRRIVRTALQLALLTSLLFISVWLLDSRYRVLPQTIHNHLPIHHPGLVVTDVVVRTCRFGACAVDPSWSRVDKDLYLGSAWITKAYVDVQRKREQDLTPTDRVVVDVRVGRLNPAASDPPAKDEKWESRQAGLWVKRSARRSDSDSARAVTAVDVLFGADAVDPRPGWEMKDRPLVDGGGAIGPRITIRRGTPAKVEKVVPRVRKDGKFKILQVSDLHLSTGVGVCRDPVPANGKCEADPRTLEFVGRILDTEKPDFVVLSGDQVNGETAPDSQTAILKFAELFISRKIPYATIPGNHDDEGSLTRAASTELLTTLPYSLTEAGPNTIPGVGNYYIQVLAHSGHHAALTLYFLDTHAYSPDEKKYHGYDWIKPEQIRWFKDTARALKADNAKYSHIHLDMAFIHIPLPEYRDGGKLVGERREGVTAPAYNSGFRDALVDVGVPVVSCGHDHANDYCLLSEPDTAGGKKDAAKRAEPDLAEGGEEAVKPKHTRNDKIWMCYAGGSGFGGYGGYGGYVRRVRVFELDAHEARISTWKRVEWGDTERRVDEQVIVDGGRVVG